MPATDAAIPPSQNEAWGFFGTITHHAEPRAAWALALPMIAEATGCSFDEVRAFLDSRYGRHFADMCAGRMTADAAGNEAAIRATVDQWMGWQTGRAESRDLGVPVGLPYLTGYTMAAAIAAEA